MEEINRFLFLKLNSLIGINNYIDLLFEFFAEYLVFTFVAVEIYLYFFVKRKDTAIFTFYSAMLALGLNQIAGLLYFHNRSFMDHLGITIIQHIPESSFPSDHTAFMFSIAIMLYLKLENKILGEVLLILAFIGSASRIVVGVHYPLDIIGAIFVAIISTFIICKFQNLLQALNNLIFKRA